MTLKIGKLYSCKAYHLLLFPDMESAERTGGRSVAAKRSFTHAASAEAAYWTEKFKKPVRYCDPEAPLLVLSVKKEYYVEVLVGDKRGWIIKLDTLNIEEIV